MTDDLIERLRTKCKMLHTCVEMRREAADEIERLRAVVDVLEVFLDGDIGYEPLEEAIAALEDDDD